MEWRTLFEGFSGDTPNLYLDRGHLYRITFWTPIPSPDWLSGAIYNAMSAIGLDVKGVGAGNTTIEITFWI